MRETSEIHNQNIVTLDNEIANRNRLSCRFLPNSFDSRRPVVREKFLEVRRGDDDAELRHDQVQVKPPVVFVAVVSRVSSSPIPGT
jgi:hypothetical protein